MKGLPKKLCSRCGNKKPLTDFYKHKGHSFGVSAVCKSCKRIRQKMYGAEHREEKKNYDKIYRTKCKEKIQAYHDNRKDKRKAYNKIYNAEHKEERKIYSAKNKEKTNGIQRKRLKEDPMFRLKRYTSAAIWASLQTGKNSRRWESLVGYSINDLKKHIEKQFVDGMTWNNYGEWHIDHKIPISVFNFTKPEHEDFKKCWDLNNLQPMWAIKNISKSNKLTKHFQPSLLIG